MHNGFICGLCFVIVPQLSFFRRLGKAVPSDCGISWMSSFIFLRVYPKHMSSFVIFQTLEERYATLFTGKYYLTLALFTTTATFANIIDPDQMASEGAI